MCTTTGYNVMHKSDLYNSNGFNDFTHVDISAVPILEEEILPDKKFIMTALQTNQVNYEPMLPTNIPITEEFPGEYNFEIICPQNKGKNCVYSQPLRKIYIDMEQRLPLRIKWDPPENNLWLRATLVYAEDQHRGNPVQRCHNHMATNSPANLNISIDLLRQVVRCMNSSSVYEEIDGHMSVTVPLGTPLPGCSYVPLDFQFFCKNSCSSGMNRRATQLVFTLETTQRQVIGRRILQVRVCSCPKRDKEKEELEIHLALPAGKKRRLPAFTTISSKLPPGKKSMIKGRASSGFHLSIDLPSKEIGKEALWEIYKILSAKATLSGEYQHLLPFMEDVKRRHDGL